MMVFPKSESRLEANTWLCDIRALRAYLTSLSLSFLVGEMEMGLLPGVTKVKPVKGLGCKNVGLSS